MQLLLYPELLRYISMKRLIVREKTDGKRSNGFTLTEALTAMLCSIILFGLLTSMTSVCKGLAQKDENKNLEFAILQIRHQCSLALQYECPDGVLELNFGSDSCQFCYDKNRIVKKPGYEIFLEGIENGRFEQTDEGVDLVYEQNGKEIRWQIMSR